MLTKAPRGTKDILPGEVGAWTHVERVIRGLCDRYGYKEIRTPHFEHTELFQRGIGDGTDVVDKEMYTFTDRGDRGLTLRPENTRLRHAAQGARRRQSIAVRLGIAPPRPRRADLRRHARPLGARPDRL